MPIVLTRSDISVSAATSGDDGGDEADEESEADRAAAEAQRVAEQYSRHSWELLVRICAFATVMMSMSGLW